MAMCRFGTKAPHLPAMGRPFVRLWHHCELADFPYRTIASASKLGTYHIQHYKFRRNAPSNRQHTGPDPGHIEVSPSFRHVPTAPAQRGLARICHDTEARELTWPP
jgi:hypothetical protein